MARPWGEPLRPSARPRLEEIGCELPADDRQLKSRLIEVFFFSILFPHLDHPHSLLAQVAGPCVFFKSKIVSGLAWLEDGMHSPLHTPYFQFIVLYSVVSP